MLYLQMVISATNGDIGQDTIDAIIEDEREENGRIENECKLQDAGQNNQTLADESDNDNDHDRDAAAGEQTDAADAKVHEDQLGNSCLDEDQEHEEEPEDESDHFTTSDRQSDNELDDSD